jgi:hypothetical protein
MQWLSVMSSKSRCQALVSGDHPASKQRKRELAGVAGATVS